MTRDELILGLYHASRELSYTAFQEYALLLLKQILPFDSALWEKAALVDSMLIAQSFHLHNQPPEMMERYEEYKHQDVLVQRVISQPGRTVYMSLEDPCWKDTEAVRLHARPYGMEHILSTASIDPVSQLYQVVSLYRARPDHPYSESERRLKESLVPHLIESLTLCRLLHIRHDVLPAWEKEQRIATVDKHGILHDVDAQFIDLLLAEWPDWQGAKLPEPLSARVAAGTGWIFQGKQITVHASGPLEELLVLTAQELGLLGRLTLRERLIAEKFAAGRTYREIAKALSISPVTARNHLAAIYKKLCVNSKVELIRILKNYDQKSLKTRQMNHDD